MLVAVGIGGIVIVRPHRFGHAPERHRQLGIELPRMLKRPRGFVVIKSEDEPQTLIEELLRLRISR